VSELICGADGTCVSEAVASAPIVVSDSILLVGIDSSKLGLSAVLLQFQSAVSSFVTAWGVPGVSSGNVSIVQLTDVQTGNVCALQTVTGSSVVSSAGVNVTFQVAVSDAVLATSVADALSSNVGSLGQAVQQQLAVLTPTLCTVLPSSQVGQRVNTPQPPPADTVLSASAKPVSARQSPSPSASGLSVPVIAAAAGGGVAVFAAVAALLYRRNRRRRRDSVSKLKVPRPRSVAEPVFQGVNPVAKAAKQRTDIVQRLAPQQSYRSSRQSFTPVNSKDRAQQRGEAKQDTTLEIGQVNPLLKSQTRGLAVAAAQRGGATQPSPVQTPPAGAQQIVRIVSNSSLAQQNSFSNITKENRDMFRTYASSAAARQLSGAVAVRRKAKVGDGSVSHLSPQVPTS